MNFFLLFRSAHYKSFIALGYLAFISLNAFSGQDLTYVPEQFIWGAALSEYQVSGAAICTKSNWSEWENRLVEKSGDACQFWDRYQEDIPLMKELGIKSLRFSIEWCKIEPEQGVMDHEAVAHYRSLIKALKDNGIEPMVTLHHFVHPDWFEKMGGFAKRKNLIYFENFCAYIFEQFADQVKLWCTINEPTVFAFQGYVRGVFPPGKVNFAAAWRVLRNMMEVHTNVYHRLKAMPHGHEAQIGLVHQYLVFESYTGWNPLEVVPGLLFNGITNNGVLDFIKTGRFTSTLGGNYTAPAGKFMDFIGLNYYSRAVIKAQMKLSDPVIGSCHDGETMTDMPYAIYPEGLYKALMDLKQCNLPIYITENGIADAKDDKRELWIKQYIAAMLRAIKEGADVRGFYYWSLLDNYEWDMGYGMRFGLYEVDFESKKRKLRDGARCYQRIIKNEQF